MNTQPTDARRPPAVSTRHRAGPSDRGSVTVLAAGLLFLAGVLSLVAVDLLRAVAARAQAQAAADAAALAAAQEMVLGGEAGPPAMAAEYAVRNGAELVWCVCPVAGTEATVEVRVTFVTVVLGGDRVATARARAVVETGGLRKPPAPTGTVGRPHSLASDTRDRSAQNGVDG